MSGMSPHDTVLYGSPLNNYRGDPDGIYTQGERPRIGATVEELIDIPGVGDNSRILDALF